MSATGVNGMAEAKHSDSNNVEASEELDVNDEEQEGKTKRKSDTLPAPTYIPKFTVGNGLIVGIGLLWLGCCGWFLGSLVNELG